MAFDDHQTQIDLDIDTRSPSTSPVVIPRTPPPRDELHKGRSRGASRNLLPTLSQAEDLANERPLWYKDLQQEETTPEVNRHSLIPYKYSSTSGSCSSTSSFTSSGSSLKLNKKKQRHKDTSTGSTPLSTISSASNGKQSNTHVGALIKIHVLLLNRS